MAPTAQLKYNPGLRGEDELVRSFVVRVGYFELILETLRANIGRPSNQHLLIVGARGTGKTTLVRRVAAELHSEPVLSEAWYPVVFAEEAYMVSTAGELWLEALFHLADQTREQRWQHSYEELRREPDEVRLRERALAQLLDFADEQGKRLLLVVENLNMLLGEQLATNADWELRHALQNEPRLMLLGTATSRFKEIDNASKAWFELLAIHQLEPLDLEECRELWRHASGESLSPSKARPVQILTGGNPRLLKILAEFAAGKSFGNLMDHLVQLLDEHTEYFKGQLDRLAPSERRAFVALLDIWDPATAQQVAQAARIEVNSASALLTRLVNRGAVEVVAQEGRKKLYQAAERLYNIYYLMRRRGHPANRVRAVVSFMVQFYPEEELVQAGRRLAEEACGLGEDQRQDHLWAYQELLRRAPAELRKHLLEQTPDSFFEAEDLPDDLRELLNERESRRSQQEHAVGIDELPEEPVLLSGTDLPSSDEKLPIWVFFSMLALLVGTKYGEWGQALKLANGTLDAAASDERAVLEATELLIEATAAGRGLEALKALQDSRGAGALEPLAVGIKLYLGESPRVAQEILETARDVRARIRRRVAASSASDS